jgi:hypothetical protein
VKISGVAKTVCGRPHCSHKGSNLFGTVLSYRRPQGAHDLSQTVALRIKTALDDTCIAIECNNEGNESVTSFLSA